MPRPSKYTRTTKTGGRVLNKDIRRLQCFIPADLMRKLKIICAAEELDISEVVAQALAEHIKKHRGKA